MSTVLDQIARWSLLGAFLDSNLSDCTVASHLHLCWGSSEKMQLCFHQGSKTKPPFAQQSKESNHKSLFSGGSKFLPTWYRCKQRFQLGRMIEMSRDRLHPMHAEQWNYLVALHPASVQCTGTVLSSALHPHVSLGCYKISPFFTMQWQQSYQLFKDFAPYWRASTSD